MGQQQQQQQFYFTQMVFPSLQIEEMSELVMRKKTTTLLSLSFGDSCCHILCLIREFFAMLSN